MRNLTKLEWACIFLETSGLLEKRLRLEHANLLCELITVCRLLRMEITAVNKARFFVSYASITWVKCAR